MQPTRPTRGAAGACALAVLVLTAHCASHADTATASSASSLRALPCDVAAVLETNCTKCHASPPAFGAPMPLVTYDDLVASLNGARVLDLALQRVTASASPMPPPPNAPLTAAEVATLQAWSNAGAPPAPTACAIDAGSSTTSAVPTTTCTPDTFLRPQTPFVLTASTPLDDYVCYGVDLDAATAKQVIGIAPHIDDTRIVHHVLLMQSDESYSPDPTPCNAGLAIGWRLVSVWAPGVQALDLPAEAGFPIGTGTTHWIVQVHYNNADALTSGTDQSGFDVCTTATLRPYDAGIVAFGGVNIDLPPYASRTMDCSYALPQAFEGARFFDAMPHMHKLGVAMSTVLHPADAPDGAGATTIADQPDFSFQTQQFFSIDVPVHAADVVETKCSWVNSTDQDVTFGEGTGNEMCFDFAAYYPLVPDQDSPSAPLFNWSTPSLGATCTLE